MIVATVYEHSLNENHAERNRSPSNTAAVHPIQLHDKQMMSFEQTNISDDDTDSMKLNKIHASNILNGCTFELHPISIENETNGVQAPPKPPPMPPSLPASPLASTILLEKNQKNQNGDDLYHLSRTNGTTQVNGNGNGNSKHHQTDRGQNNNNNNHNKHQQCHNQCTIINRKNNDSHNCSEEIVEKVDTKQLGESIFEKLIKPK